MRLLTPFELIQRFPEGQRLILVGNAPSLAGEGLGSWIDEHDIVVRFNTCPTEGHEADVGRRTDILIVNPYPEDRPPPSLSDPARGVILVLTPQTRRGDLAAFADWAADHSVFFTYTPDLVGVGNIDHTAGLTTGTYALHLLPRLLSPATVSVTGFTMFLADTAHHYFSRLTPKGLKGHDVEAEAKLFIRLCNRPKCAVTVTEEIRWVAAQCGEPLKKGIQVRPLQDTRWQVQPTRRRGFWAWRNKPA